MKDFLLDYSYQVLTLVLIALAIGCIFLFITKGYWRGVLWSGFALICCMEAMLCLIAQHHYPTFLGPFASDVNTITNYTVRINIVDRQQMPVEDASVWSSIGEVRKMDHGWELSIPVMSLPPDKKKLTITATKESPPLSGQVVVELHDTANIATTIELAKDVSSDIHGLVVDKDEKPISDAKVIVQGYGGNPAHTNSRGEFRFPPSWGRNEQVFLTVEKEGYKSVTEIPQMAGDEPAYVILTRR